VKPSLSDSTLSAAQASAFALGMTRQLSTSPTFRGLFEGGHGAAIDFDHLGADPRVEFADCPYLETPSTWPGYRRRPAAPVYLIRILSNGEPALSVSVSVLATDVSIVAGQVIAKADTTGGEFFYSATPIVAGPGWHSPIGPEQAVALVAQASGARIAAVPTLLKPERIYSIAFARWHLVLDRAVTFRSVTTGALSSTNEVYVGVPTAENARSFDSPVMYVPSANQPQEDLWEVEYPQPIKPGVPTTFDQVVVQR
jgi:hypothetical protein